MMVVEAETIEKAVSLIQQAAPGAKVILFGSYARGEPHPDSDVDHLVIEPELTSAREEMVRLGDVIRPLRFPADVLVTSAQTFKKWADFPGTVLYEAAREGRVYEPQS